jgi:hypothetical protein
LDLETGDRTESAAARERTNGSEKADGILENLTYMEQIVARSSNESREDLKADI